MPWCIRGSTGSACRRWRPPRDVERIDDYLTLLERARGLADGQVAIAAWIENAHAVANAYEICQASERLVGICGGRRGLCGEHWRASQQGRRGARARAPRRGQRGSRSGDSAARYAVDRHSRCRGLRGRAAPDARDRLSAASSASTPTSSLRPTASSRPPEGDIEWARRVVEAYEDGVAKNLGAVALDDQMIDKPVLDQAENMLEWSSQIAEMEAAR